MFTVRAERKGRRAFTLLEITLAVAIFGMMALAIFRFVSAHITAVRISSELNEVDASYGGLERLLTDQLRELPPGQGTLLGQPFKFEGRSRDEMTWVCEAGSVRMCYSDRRPSNGSTRVADRAGMTASCHTQSVSARARSRYA